MATALFLLAACSSSSIVKIDGSSTVFPITEAMAEELHGQGAGVKVVIGISGTGGGFKKFCNGEIDIADASRPIKTTEAEACARNGIGYIELPVAYDGISIIVNTDNDWVDFMTLAELQAIWEPGSQVDRWSDIRATWPDESIFLVGADTDSGTFDYFTQAVNGKSGASRPDYVASADDNVLVRAVSQEDDALGYLGFAFFSENANELRAVPVDSGSGPVAPSETTIKSGEYSPLSRPLLIYVNIEAASRPDVSRFIDFYLEEPNSALIRDVGYVPLPPEVSLLVRERFEHKVTGTIYRDGPQIGGKLKELLEGG